MNQKLTLGAIVIIVLGAAVIVLLQQEKIQQLAAANDNLNTQLAQIASLQETKELLEAQLKAAVEASEVSRRELLRLRGQAGRTRQLEQENTQLRAQSQQLERRELESESASAEEALVTSAVKRLQDLKTALVDFYGKHGALPTSTGFIEPMLTSEGLLEEATPALANIRTRTVRISSDTDPVTASNQAYSLDGGLTNNVTGRLVVEAVVGNVTATVARKLSLVMDGEPFSSPIGEADLVGRVKYGAIPADGVGEVHVYLTHR